MNTSINTLIHWRIQTAIDTWSLALMREMLSERPKQKEANYGCLEIFNSGGNSKTRHPKKGKID